MTKEEFRERCHTCIDRCITQGIDRSIDKVLASGCIDLDNAENNYKAVYPFLAAFLQDAAEAALNAPIEAERKRLRREAHNIAYFI